MVDRQQRRELTPEEREEHERQFFERLTDWSDQGALMLIRRGEPVEVPPVRATRDIDRDGDAILNDDSVIVPVDSE